MDIIYSLRRAGNITKRKIKVLKTKMKNLFGESLTHLDEEFEKFKKGILKVKDYLFTFLTILPSYTPLQKQP